MLHEFFLIIFFRNSTLQCLLNTPGFSDYFEKKDSYSLKGKFGIAYNFAELVKGIRAKSSGHLIPRELKNSVGKKTRRFVGYGQQDAQEFLVFLLEGISEELNRVRTKPKYVELDFHENQSVQKNVNFSLIKFFRVMIGIIIFWREKIRL